MALKFIIARDPNNQEIFLNFPSPYLSEIFITENSVVLFFSSQTVTGDGDVLSDKYYYGTRIVLSVTGRGSILGNSLARLLASAMNSPEVESRFDLFKLADSVSVEDIVGSSPTGGGATGSGETLNSVTTRGATTSNEITVGGITADFVQLDVTATPTPQQGMFSWNEDRSTANLQLDADVAAKIGQDNYWYVKNQSGSDIPIRTPVRAAGTLGASGRILVSPMIADGSVDPKFLLGITAEKIANGADGFVMNIGKLRQVNTSAFPEGTVLYCDPLVAGGLTGAEPEAPNLKLPIAFCINQSSNNGTIAIRTNPGSDLYSDHRVQVDQAGLTGGQLLRYNGSLTRWENWTPNFLTTVPTLDQVTTAGNVTLNNITAGVLISKDSLNRSVSITGSNNTIINWSNGTLDTQRGGVTVSRLSEPGGVGYFVQRLNVNVPNVITNLNAALGVRGSGTSSSTTALRVENSSAVASLVVNDAGNVLIGTTTDAGYKLDVNGTARISNTLTALTISSNNITANTLTSGGGTNDFVITGSRRSTTYGTSIYFTGVAIPNTQAANSDFIQFNQSFTQTSGAFTYNVLNIANTYNQSSTANGTIRGIYYNPTLTSVLGNHIAIHTVSGKIIHQGLTNATQTNQVYYNTTTGELTYGALASATSQSVADASKITTFAPTGSTQISSVSSSTYTSARFEYTITDSTNYRTGTISAVWDNSTVQFAETSTSDIGDTSALTFAVSVTGGTAELVANAVTGGWTVYVVGYGI